MQSIWNSSDMFASHGDNLKQKWIICKPWWLNAINLKQLTSRKKERSYVQGKNHTYSIRCCFRWKRKYVLTKLRFTNTILNRFQMFIPTLMVMVMLLLMLPLMLLLMVIITVNGNTNLMLLLTPPPHMHQFLVTKWNSLKQLYQRWNNVMSQMAKKRKYSWKHSINILAKQELIF